jgi:hypothetical protein
MNDEQPNVAVVFQGDRPVKKPKVYPWHWVAYYAYNLWRKPKVWRWKREQSQIYLVIRQELNAKVLPDLVRRLGRCSECQNAYGSLHSQSFISSIDMILKNMRCEEHPAVFDAFRAVHAKDFARNERLAAAINGFLEAP